MVHTTAVYHVVSWFQTTESAHTIPQLSPSGFSEVWDGLPGKMNGLLSRLPVPLPVVLGET